MSRCGPHFFRVARPAPAPGGRHYKTRAISSALASWPTNNLLHYGARARSTPTDDCHTIAGGPCAHTAGWAQGAARRAAWRPERSECVRDPRLFAVRAKRAKIELFTKYSEFIGTSNMLVVFSSENLSCSCVLLCLLILYARKTKTKTYFRFLQRAFRTAPGGGWRNGGA